MSQDSSFMARNVELASLLHYVLGPDAHVSTHVEGQGASSRYFFYFAADYTECLEVQRHLYSEDGAIVDNALALFKASSDIRQTMRSARNSPTGTWERTPAPPTEGTE
jgi:hypothetical protein